GTLGGVGRELRFGGSDGGTDRFEARLAGRSVEGNARLGRSLGERGFPGGILFRAPGTQSAPGGENSVGNLERRIGPAERFARGFDLLGAERLAMRRAFPRLVRRPVADGGLAGDEPRFRAVAPCLGKRG